MKDGESLHGVSFLDDPDLYRPLALKAIQHYGSEPEHNLDWYEYETRPDQKPVVVYWQGGSAILTHKKASAWHVFSEPLAPAGQKTFRLIQFIKAALGEAEIKKVVLELGAESRMSLRKALPSQYKDTAIYYTLTSPIFDVGHFDPALPGKFFKRLRNINNRFHREHTVEIRDAHSVSGDELIGIIDRWRKRRGATDRVDYHRYANMIKRNFAGFETARVFFVDGKAVAINAGWPVVNRKGYYYAAVGMHDYSIDSLGEIINLEDLEWIKNAGYDTADFGGGEKALTDFKKQFGPKSFYKRFIFSIVRY